MSTAKVTLVTSGGSSQDFTSEQTNITTDFARVRVTKGMWIFYQQANYNDASGGGSLWIKLDESSHLMDLPFTPRSFRPVKTFQVGATLYKHVNFGGKELDLPNSNPRIDIGGVSSALISQGQWRLYEQYDYAGPSTRRGPGVYVNAGALGVANDALKSMEREF
uniref:Beta-gamma-crystallin n=1 Tax=Geodia cydonium TaxID=6047 RepID=O18426_GEOCY|nr:beta-gamma-crystallin [Geodia cydonium]